MLQWLQRLFSAPAAPPPRTSAPPSAAPAAIPVSRAGASAHGASAPVSTASPNAGAVPADSAAPQLAATVTFDQRDSVNTSYQHWLFNTEGDSGLDTNPLEDQVLAALGAILASQQSGAALVRRLPGLIPQLLQSLRSDTFSGAQLSRTISSDVVLVAAVIRLANTSVKGSGQQIGSVEHAVMLIGQEGLRHLITSVAFRPIIDLNSGHYTRTLAPRIWDQSERCAVASRLLAEELGIDPFEAFLAGLVQNVGLIVTLRIMDQITRDNQAESRSDEAQPGTLGSELFSARLVSDARALTCSIGREWHFPETVVKAIAEQGGARKGVNLSPLGRLLALSDYLSKTRILVDAERLGKADPSLFKGLPPSALACYRALDALADGAAPDEAS